ncbi:MAG TPA: Smr/MutS family protein [Albidovulum sp.]|uniref:Smr/MutS family protein n=1 Tax=Albidovulum sp. TaxID=1872424 RepID=UPI002B63797F|nr:Smr/MutS family protein [Albidovulum sp.]
MSRKRRGLSPEDEDLWRRVAATAVPMHRRQASALPEPEPKAAARRPVTEMPADFTIAPAPRQYRSHVTLQPSVEETVAAHPLRMDAGTFRKMKRGKSEPEARIDLHGMTLAEAHPALIGFVLRAQSAGNRLVLVITGKGKRRDDDGPIPQRLGALRHQVPHWLHAPPLAGAVQQIAQAHLRHGGSGAYYVYLRRR